MAQGIGAFLAHWTVGNAGMPGAPILTIDAIVTVAPNQKIAGQAHLTQTTNPPLDVEFDINGSYHDSTGTANTHHFAHVASVSSPLLGAPTLDVLMDLSQDWQTGTATIRYSIGSTTNVLRDVPVRATAAGAATA